MKIVQLLFLMSAVCPVNCRVAVTVDSGSPDVELHWAWQIKRKWQTRTVSLLIHELDDIKKLVCLIQDVKEMGWEKGD